MHADLRGASLNKANLHGAWFADANVEGASFSSCVGAASADFSNALGWAAEHSPRAEDRESAQRP